MKIDESALAAAHAEIDGLKRQLAEAKKLIFTNRELDGLLERWDQTPPELQRHIAAAFAARLAASRERERKLIIQCHETLNALVMSVDPGNECLVGVAIKDLREALRETGGD